MKLQALESWLETDFDRGVFNAAEVPGDRSCLLQTLQINRPVTWRSSGSRQAQLLQTLGAGGSTVDSVRYGFILVAANLPLSDTYQDSGVGQQSVGINNISILGGTSSQSVDFDSTTVSYTNDGLLFQNPAGKASTTVSAVLQNLQVDTFPGNGLSANSFSGEFRAYNVFAGHAGGNCVDLEYTGNPYRFYGLVAAGCATGINMVHTGSEEFHGASVFGNGIDVSVSGTLSSGAAYVLFDGLQLGRSDRENLYLDQQNETVICAANCVFTGANDNCTGSADCNATVVIGPDATTIAGSGLTRMVAQFNQGLFAGDELTTDILFEQNATA